MSISLHGWQTYPAKPNTTGCVYIDHHCSGSDAEQRRLLDALDNGRLNYIEGMRRVGKSSLLKSIERDPRDRAARDPRLPDGRGDHGR